MTKSKRCDIIDKLLKSGEAKLPISCRIGTKSRKFEKNIFRNLLTKTKRCDIITKSSERDDELRSSLKIEQYRTN